MLVLVLAILAAAALLVVAPPGPAPAAPSGSSDPEGGTPELRARLDAASRGYTTAAARLTTSKARQAKLVDTIRTSSRRTEFLRVQVEAIAVQAYKGGQVGAVATLLDSGSAPVFLDKLATLDQIARRNAGQLSDLKAAQRVLAEQKAALDREVRTQETQVQTMAKGKADAEKALAAYGSNTRTAGFRASRSDRTTGTSTDTGSGPALPGAARPARRAADGSWPDESCSVDDPTTSGCLTPRTAHALAEARAAGFTRYAACYRSSSSGEHGKGRACDLAAQPDAFGGDATGGDREYGNRLAAWLVGNADRLAVLYVIWYRQIWLPGTGWRSYSRGGGDPASDHTNHVHLSVQ